MAGRGRGMSLFKKLAEKAATEDESQLDDSASVVAPTELSFAAARGPLPLRTFPAFLETETDDTASEVAPSSVPFVLPARGRGMFGMSVQKTSTTGSKESDDSPQADQAPPSTIPKFMMGGRGRGVTLQSSGRGSGSDTSKDKATKSSIELMTEQLKIDDDDKKEQIEEIAEATPKVISQAPKEPVLKHGCKGEKYTAISNSIMIECQKDYGMYEYDVRFSPPLDDMRSRKVTLRKMADTIGTIFNYDGGETLYLPIQLPSQVITKTIENITAKISFRRQRSLSECTHFYNVLFDRIMYELKFERIGRKYFDPVAPKMIPQHKLQVWPGYVKVVEELEGGLMLTLDVSHRVLNQRTVYEFVQDCVNNSKKGGGSWQELFKKGIIGCIVMTQYNNKTYRIDDVLFDQSPKTTFEVKDGSKLTYADYYKQQYGITIRDQNQPILLNLKRVRTVGETEKKEFLLGLIPELCQMTGLTDEMRSSFTVMKDLATHTKLAPSVRLGSFKEFLARVNGSEKALKILDDWGLKLAKSPIGVTARLLDEEMIFFGDGKKQSTGQNADFSRGATSNAVLEVFDLTSWMLIFDKRDKTIADNFEKTLFKISGPTGIRCDAARRFELANDRTESYINAIKTGISKDPSTQMVVTIFPTLRDDRYAAVKKTLCLEIPCPSQCINTKTLRNENKARSIILKILLQINVKLGGTLWGVKIPLQSTMIVGIDTYHEVGNRGNTVGGLVASINGAFTRYFSRPHIQGPKEELISGLTHCLVSALECFKQYNNKQLPEKIIIYRDGVGDGQLDQVHSCEVPQFEYACGLVAKDYKPKITFVVVQKRINLKFFKVLRDQVTNPPPGSILDNTVTRRYLYDFYLCSQHVREGTTTPSHYIVLRDDNNFEPDIVQKLTYKLTYMYYNWPGAVRVPAPCQYAHKLVTLIGTSVKKQVSEKLCDKLFYL